MCTIINPGHETYTIMSVVCQYLIHVKQLFSAQNESLTLQLQHVQSPSSSTESRVETSAECHRARLPQHIQIQIRL